MIPLHQMRVQVSVKPTRRQCKIMADAAIEKAVLAYLKRKGYKNSELAFKDESLADKSDAARGRESEKDQALANQIM